MGGVLIKIAHLGLVRGVIWLLSILIGCGQVLDSTNVLWVWSGIRQY